MIELTTEYGNDRKQHNIIKIEEATRKIVVKDSKVNTIPTKLPMIVKPKPYKLVDGKIILGGYQKNDYYYNDALFIPKVGYKNTTTLFENNDIIALINGVSSVPYRINKKTLEFIRTYGIEKGIIFDINQGKLKDFNLNPYKKISKKENRELRSKLSIIQLQNNILNIAETYLESDNIYFPVRLDQRTRLYCTTEYFNYQSTDLAKGLLCFSKKEFIFKHDSDGIKYFKSYGAILFDSALGKKSLNLRVKWVDKNRDYILNFESNDIINVSQNKACFVSFCFEYKRFIKFMNDLDATTFITDLPIQLDASCNGYQHISLLTREKKILKHLNLTASTNDDNPEDFYNFILLKVKH